MKVRDFIELWKDGTHNDVDVYDNVVEELGIAYCGCVSLTENGREHFAEVLDFEINVDEPHYIAIVDVDAEEGVWQKKLKKAKEFFYAAAGYCDCDDYDKWFVEVD